MIGRVYAAHGPSSAQNLDAYPLMRDTASEIRDRMNKPGFTPRLITRDSWQCYSEADFEIFVVDIECDRLVQGLGDQCPQDLDLEL